MQFPDPGIARPDAGRLMLSLLPVLWTAAPVAAQQHDPIVRASETPRVEQRVNPGQVGWRGPEAEGREGTGLDLKMVVSAAYDDNIFLSSDNPTSDLVLTVSPQVSLRSGGEPGGDAGFIRVAYLPALVIYQDNSGFNRVDHDLRLAGGWRGKAVTIAYDGSFRRLGDATADAGAPADRNAYESAARVAWQLREKLALVGAVGINGTRYDSSAFFDTRQYYGETGINYEYSPKTRLALLYRIGREEVDGSGNQTVQRVLARMAWQPREKISVDIGAGVEHRKYDIGSGTEPVLDGRISWSPREGTEVYLAGFLREEASGFFEGQNYQLANATMGLSQALGNGWTARIEGGTERASYLRVSGTGQADRVDRILFIEPAIEYSPNDSFKVGVFYRFSDNSSNEDGFGYKNHQTGVGMEYRF